VPSIARQCSTSSTSDFPNKSRYQEARFLFIGDEVPDHPKVKDKVASGATYEDALTLANYENIEPRTNERIAFIKEAMGYLLVARQARSR
jgi:hypothetical protein